MPITRGVPQGSVLGPVFTLYVNDISNRTTCKPRLFADDTCLMLSKGKGTGQRVQAHIV